MNTKLFFLCICISSIAYSQSIQNYYSFRWYEKEGDTITHNITDNNISIRTFSFPSGISKPREKYYKEKQIYIYQNEIIKDSLNREAWTFSRSEDQVIRTTSHIYFVRSIEVKDPLTHKENDKKQLVTIDKKKAKVENLYWLPDSIHWFSGKCEDNFIYNLYKGNRYPLYAFSPQTKTSKLLYDFAGKVDEEYGIGDFIYLKGKNKLLIMATSAEPGLILDVKYFILDLKKLQVEDVTFHFNKLTELPQGKFKDHPGSKYFYFEPRYKSYYNDITDTIAYIQAANYYGAFLNKKTGLMDPVMYPQDMFVVNNEYQIIDRVLTRESGLLDGSGMYAVYEKDKKKSILTRSQTDSASCYFNIAIKYPLEKAFYNIYYNKELSDKDLQGFDQYELLLLKNFIYAKYNYKFSNPFYEAYYNTFTFYHDFQTWDAGKKKLERRKKVNKYFTKEDSKNLALILIKIRE